MICLYFNNSLGPRGINSFIFREDKKLGAYVSSMYCNIVSVHGNVISDHLAVVAFMSFRLNSVLRALCNFEL